MATIYADPRFQPRHTIRTFALIVLAALATFLLALYAVTHYELTT